MKTKNKFFSGKHVSQIVLVTFILSYSIFGAVSFQYYKRLQITIRDESIGYLREISRRIESGVNKFIDDNYSVLNTIAAVMENAEANSFIDVESVVTAQKEYWNYKDIVLIDENGKAFSVYGKEVTLNNDTYFYDAVLNKKNGISTTQLINNKECIMLTIPLDNKFIDGKNMVALGATYDPASFDKTLSMSSFGGQAYSCIISKSGTVVVRSSAASSQKIGYNVLTTIASSKLETGYSIEQIKKDMENDLEGQIIYSMNGSRYYMVYTPVEPEDWYLLTFVPTNAVNEKSDLLLHITFLFCGLIAVVFSGLLAFILFTFYRNKRRLERIAYVDEVTQGNTIQRFYDLATNALGSPSKPQYALIYTNIQKFKVLNEQFGKNICDNILYAFYSTIQAQLKNKECLGRLSGDNFCILMQYEEEQDIVRRFENWNRLAEEYIEIHKPIWTLPVVEFGVYIIDNDTIPFPQMIDRAKLALRELPRSINSKLYYGIYDDMRRRQLFREKQLEDMSDGAMRDREFQVYLQPKYCTDSKQIGGAEALVRWISKTEGMIYPDSFIPLFEKNGYIIQLDLFVFEEVCRTLRRWIDEGRTPVKISVNCSRVHLRRIDFMEAYRKIVSRYEVPPELIEIELTESVVMETTERLSDIVEDIHRSGFGFSMDDFGSGYSSLNLLQSISVDTLKLDKIFFRSSAKDSGRMESVLSSIISMAQALSMTTVAEGVEYPEQVEMLEKMGCDYIQGFVFARPMPIDDFEQLAFHEPDIKKT